jgi:recombination protein RecR
MKYPHSIEKLLKHLQKLPGVGKRTAERFAFDLLARKDEGHLDELASALRLVKEEICECQQCGAFTDTVNCYFCTDTTRRRDLLCVVASPKDVFTIEGTREYRGLYHVLHGLLSPLDGRGEEILQFSKLLARIQADNIKEIIIALDSTLEGDATALFLKDQLATYDVQVSRLAFGIPVGSSLEYVDGGTLARALVGRASF